MCRCWRDAPQPPQETLSTLTSKAPVTDSSFFARRGMRFSKNNMTGLLNAVNSRSIKAIKASGAQCSGVRGRPTANFIPGVPNQQNRLSVPARRSLRGDRNRTSLFIREINYLQQAPPVTLAPPRYNRNGSAAAPPPVTIGFVRANQEHSLTFGTKNAPKSKKHKTNPRNPSPSERRRALQPNEPNPTNEHS
jgi:hypothetical protein